MSFCAGCIDLKELPGSPTGTEKQIAGLTVYVAEGSKKGSILIAPDIYGLGIVNPRIVADKLAKQSGFTVFAVDYFKGGQMKPEEFELPSKASEGPPDEAKMGKNFENFMAWQTWETKLKAKNLLDAASTTYPNTVHGFGLRPDLQDTQVKSGWEKSIDATSSFFNKVFA
ncbi:CARBOXYMETHYLENEBUTENOLIDASE HOMOLOG [Ceraceosorus bombacis]|uniref:CARBOXYMETHYLENEBUTENOLIDASE HOMOLOG n=1 Tax=Ceraceosorus bombacis TaxID=401625 RepID=A0A0P1BN18_9BASI|nr:CARBOXYMETHYLENEBUTENOLIDASE HOMOLOG [Ceraceosorus bombacis]